MNVQAAIVLALTIVLAGSTPADVWREDFASDPRTRGWADHGDASHFQWDARSARLAVTWDSSRPNALFHFPLPTILTRAESFGFRFKLVLTDIVTESPETTFQIALGLIRRADAFSPAAFRGSGIHPTWGPRNLLEFDYFPPSASISPTFSAVAVATNNTRWSTLDLFPFELEPGATYDIEVRHNASESQVSLRVLRNGVPFTQGTQLVNRNFGDFRLDAFSVTSYSGDHQPAGYGGQLVAHGFVDDVELEYPSPPRPSLDPPHPGEPPVLRLAAIPGWSPTLERRHGDSPWVTISGNVDTNAGHWSFSDPSPPDDNAFYRVRLDRP